MNSSRRPSSPRQRACTSACGANQSRAAVQPPPDGPVGPPVPLRCLASTPRNKLRRGSMMTALPFETSELVRTCCTDAVRGVYDDEVDDELRRLSASECATASAHAQHPARLPVPQVDLSTLGVSVTDALFSLAVPLRVQLQLHQRYIQEKQLSDAPALSPRAAAGVGRRDTDLRRRPSAPNCSSRRTTACCGAAVRCL